MIVLWGKDANMDNNVGDNLTGVSWPRSTDKLCHQCCHSFDGVPVPLPEFHDPRKNTYYCRGNFCSWQCAKAYNLYQTNFHGKGNRCMYIAILAHQLWVKSARENGKIDGFHCRLKTYAFQKIDPAPPRESLQIFGGPLSIEDYRKGSFGIVPPAEATTELPFQTLRQRLSQNTPDSSSIADASRVWRKNARQSQEKSRAHAHSNDFCDKLNRARTDNSVMRRKHTSCERNTLMSSMGVTVAAKKKKG